MSKPSHLLPSLAFLVLIIGVNNVSANCKQLPKKEGVNMVCRDPGTRKKVDCHSDRLPLKTVAEYKCSNYYIPLNPDSEEGSMECASRGRWSGRDEFSSFACTIDCGYPRESLIGLVIGGIQTNSSEWPWHASIYLRADSTAPFKYVCGGTLIKPYSKGFVILTAAHCVANARGTERDRQNIKIVLAGESSKLEDNERNPVAQIHNVRKIVLHESFQSQNYQGDIAIIQLEDPVKLTDDILPACFSKTSDLAQRGSVGELVGFGLYDFGNSETSLDLKKASLPVVHPDRCYEWKQNKLLPQEICAGHKMGQSACNGDSGGGLVFKTKQNGAERYFIEGIVSHGRRGLDDNKQQCDNYSVFTRVNSYANWVLKTAEKIFSEFEEDEEVQDGQASTKLPSRIKETTTVATTMRTTPPRSTSTTTPRPPPKPSATTSNYYPESPKQTSPSSNYYPPSEIYPTRRPPNHRPQPSVIPPESSVINSYEAYALDRHNYYRRMHGSPEMRLNQELNRKAQAYADKLIREGIFVNQNEPGINKNIFQIRGKSVTQNRAIKSSVDAWYNSIKSYNWDFPNVSTFSQVVWRSSSDLGIGVATQGERTVIVAAYSPPGNLLGENGKYFHENVFPKQESLQDDDYQDDAV